MNAFADKASLQTALEISSKVNSVFLAKSNESSRNVRNMDPSSTPLLERLSPQLSDLGLRLEHVTKSFPENSPAAKPILDYHHLTTDQMMITSRLANPILAGTSANKPSMVLTYLANGAQRIEMGKPFGRNVPYSTISAVDWSVLGGMFNSKETQSPNQPNWVVVTQWLADELEVKVGDGLRIEYFLPETVDGEEIEKSYDLTVAAIAPLTEPKTPFGGQVPATFDESPTPFNDPAWTPVVPGITDQESIDKWDTPFPLKRKREKQDNCRRPFHKLRLVCS